MNGTCIIVGAGEFAEKTIEKRENDILIAADGGVKNLESIGIAPDIVVGDFDSLGYEPDFENLIRLPKEKDLTDTAVAIETGLSQGYKKFRIFGGTGGRTDHTIANIQNIVNLAKKGFYAELVDEKQVYTALVNGEISFDESYLGYISVFSYSDISNGVFESGLKYNLNNETLYSTNPIGVSNEFIGKKTKVGVKDGILLIIYDRQDK